MSKLLVKNPSNTFVGGKNQLVRIGNEWKGGKQIWEKVGTNWVQRWTSARAPFDTLRVSLKPFFDVGSPYFKASGFNFDNAQPGTRDWTPEIGGGINNKGLPGIQNHVVNANVPCVLGGVYSRFVYIDNGYGVGSIVIKKDSAGKIPSFKVGDRFCFRFNRDPEAAFDVEKVVYAANNASVTLDIVGGGMYTDFYNFTEQMVNNNKTNEHAPLQIIWGAYNASDLPDRYPTYRIGVSGHVPVGGKWFVGFNSLHNTTPFANSPNMPSFGTTSMAIKAPGNKSWTIARLICRDDDDLIELIVQGPELNFAPLSKPCISVFNEDDAWITGTREIVSNAGYQRLRVRSPKLKDMLVRNQGAGPTPIEFKFNLI